MLRSFFSSTVHFLSPPPCPTPPLASSFLFKPLFCSYMCQCVSRPYPPFTRKTFFASHAAPSYHKPSFFCLFFFSFSLSLSRSLSFFLSLFLFLSRSLYLFYSISGKSVSLYHDSLITIFHHHRPSHKILNMSLTPNTGCLVKLLIVLYICKV